MFNSAQLAPVADESDIQLTSITITAHISKGAVSSVLQHNPVERHTDPHGKAGAECPRQVVTHKARRFERAAACPVGTAQRMYDEACTLYPNVPCELRFA